MNAVPLFLLVAAIGGVDGDTAQIDAGLAHGLRAGDAGRVFYQLTVGDETRRVEVGEATVTDADEFTATCRVPAGETRPGFLVQFELPADRAGPEGMLERARTRLSALAEDDLDTTVRLWLDRLIPADPRVEDAVVRVLRKRRPARLAEGRPAAPPGPAPQPTAAPVPQPAPAPAAQPAPAPAAQPTPAPARRPTPAPATRPKTVVPSRNQVLIPGRVYLVGVDLREAEFFSQQPRFAVELKSFLFDARPVSKAELRAFQRGFVFPESAGEEATGVTWGEADTYCRGQGLRLPTEFEWEIAMKTAGVRADLLEWTSSWYEPYPGNRYPEPEYGQEFRVVRGAASAAAFDVHRRRFVAPESRHRKLGFRCAKDPEISQ